MQHGPGHALQPAGTESRRGAPRASLSGMFAIRRLLKRSRLHASPGPHSGLGVMAYSPVTSPLRRYLDLVGISSCGPC